MQQAGRQLRALAWLILAWTLVALASIALALLGGCMLASPVWAQSPPPVARPYQASLLRAAHGQWGLDAPVAVLAAQVHQESAWKPQAVSHVGARGLAQFMPETARWWCELNSLAPLDCQPHNPSWALRALAGYDKYLFDRTPGRYATYDRMWVALRGYNGGLGHWQAEARQASGDSRTAVDAACGRARRHPSHCPENLAYPARILDRLQPLYAGWGPLLTQPREAT